MSLSQHQMMSIAIIFLGSIASLVQGFTSTSLLQNTATKQYLQRQQQHQRQQQQHQRQQQQLKSHPDSEDEASLSRRNIVIYGFASLSTIFASNSPASAKYVLNDEGEYDEVPEDDWQTVWKQRLDKANSMSTDEIFAAARGAGNLDLKEGEESDVSKKRRAMSACRDSGLRSKAGEPDIKVCNSRVMQGDTDFILSK